MSAARALEALARELGPVGMVRFLQQFESGSGDYTAERRQWLDKIDLQTAVDTVRSRNER
jgi:hypothetical protein